MQTRRDLRRISALLEDVLQAGTSEPGALAFSEFAAVNYRRRQRNAAVPFWDPCLVLVLSGRKSVRRGDEETPCPTGEYLALPAPCTLDVVNTPDPSLGRFLAVLIPFDRAVVERFRRLHPITLPPPAPTPALHVGPQAQLDAAVLHFLDGASAPQPAKAILEHRLMEVLLCLVTVCDESHMLLSMSRGCVGRLQALLHRSREKVAAQGCLCAARRQRERAATAPAGGTHLFPGAARGPANEPGAGRIGPIIGWNERALAGADRDVDVMNRDERLASAPRDSPCKPAPEVHR